MLFKYCGTHQIALDIDPHYEVMCMTCELPISIGEAVIFMAENEVKKLVVDGIDLERIYDQEEDLVANNFIRNLSNW